MKRFSSSGVKISPQREKKKRKDSSPLVLSQTRPEMFRLFKNPIANQHGAELLNIQVTLTAPVPARSLKLSNA